MTEAESLARFLEPELFDDRVDAMGLLSTTIRDSRVSALALADRIIAHIDEYRAQPQQMAVPEPVIDVMAQASAVAS